MIRTSSSVARVRAVLLEPLPVILDDEFAHSDPDRIAMMNNIFSDFGDEQQFIMLTCHADKFAGYKPVKTIDLAALREA